MGKKKIHRAARASSALKPPITGRRTEILGFLERMVTKTAEQLKSSGSLIPAPDGILLEFLDGKSERLGLRENSSESDNARYVSLMSIVAILRQKGTPGFTSIGAAFMVGAMCAEAAATADIKQRDKQIERLTRHRRLGGKATRKLSPEQETIVKDFIKAEFQPGVSKTAACQRAAAKFSKKHGITISAKTLSSLVPELLRENAERFPKS